MDEYAKLIFDKLIEGHEFNYSEIALGLAKINPKLFCELAKIEPSISISIYRDIDALLHGNRVIDAIKQVRVLYGWGLREAKDFVDERREALGLLSPRTLSPNVW